ncbi:biogenesis of lysosome-related organelles complex 1 subunit 4-like isoform X1 [Amblyraja radiata]|uniref:biogenesis of lysosome-related organelles complex 1 subunit 4-like isoform X1 n=1 Tax=Amblyraja radiata TaxID=386614 RepID=UPI0014020265|nr:biogenesis of lysosome-related organelles complex 1 subunit 4-like isoform X1 [Amblyraja radiata]
MADSWAAASNGASASGGSSGQEEEDDDEEEGAEEEEDDDGGPDPGPGRGGEAWGPGPAAAQPDSEQEALLQQLRRTASFYSDCLTASAGQEIQELDICLEEMLTRVDEFCGMLEMIRNDSSQIMNENIPEIHAKADEMKHMYKKIDKLEAFVKLVGQNLSTLDDQVTQAEAQFGTFPSAFRKMLQSFSPSTFFNKSSSPKKQQQKFEIAPLFRAEDYFPAENPEEHE